MPKIAAMARRYQPAVLMVDRTVPGEFENYQTPERGIPDSRLDVPWESCIPLGNDWGYVPSDVYKTPTKVIHTLAEITAKGGNLLLGIGPKPDGTLPDEVTERLAQVGAWLQKNGEAIFGARPALRYHSGSTWFTQSKDGKKTYAIACWEEGKPIPQKITWQGNEPAPGSKVICLQTGKPVAWKKTADGVELTLPTSKNLPTSIAALAFAFE
jgi:alpha-L-fucosidase